jgi:hypothetical protein
MKLTKTLLEELIREALEIHVAPENLADIDPEEAYGMGYKAKGKLCGKQEEQVPSGISLEELVREVIQEVGFGEGTPPQGEWYKKQEIFLEEEDENNPWAICTASVGRKDKDKYERCVQSVKRKNNK